MREVKLNMSELSVSRLAYILALIGGILMVILGLLSFITSSFDNFGPFLHWGFAYGSIVTIICGAVAIIGSKSANTLAWALVLIIVGIIGGGIGGFLVVIGGLLGLVTTLTKKA
jgi:hypothetical protein